MEIRELESNDYNKEYLELLNQLRPVQKYSYTKFNEIITHISKHERNKKTFVIENDNIICGTISIVIETKFIYEGKSLVHIEDLVIHEKYRKNGYGTKLIDHCLSYAKQHNCQKIALCSRTDATEFYAKKNFKIIGSYFAKYEE